MLTTYGYGTPGTTLTWEVGGKPGDSFVVSAGYPRAPLMGSPAAVGLGEIGLAQILGLELAPGVVSGPHNVGSLSQVLPPQLEVLGPVEVAFQALVFPAAGGAPVATNTTRVTLGPAASQDAMAGVGPGAGPPTVSSWPRNVGPPANGDPLARTQAEVLHELALFDPHIAWRMQHGELGVDGPESAVGSPPRR